MVVSLLSITVQILTMTHLIIFCKTVSWYVASFIIAHPNCYPINFFLYIKSKRITLFAWIKSLIRKGHNKQLIILNTFYRASTNNGNVGIFSLFTERQFWNILLNWIIIFTFFWDIWLIIVYKLSSNCLIILICLLSISFN